MAPSSSTTPKTGPPNTDDAGTDRQPVRAAPRTLANPLDALRQIPPTLILRPGGRRRRVLPGPDLQPYSNYTPSQSGFSSPYTGGLPPKKQVRIDSHSALLGSPPWQPPPPTNRQASYTYHPPGHIAFYNKYWHPSWNMYFFLFAGVAFALGHHFFYQGLHGIEAKEQLRMLRYGAALAFLSKASLASAVILAFRQRVWMTVRRKMLTLAAVDSLFAAAEDMSAIFNFEVFKQARVAMVLALYVWCTPLVVILTSDTLAVQPEKMTKNTTCPSVRTLNFAKEDNNNWRTPTKIKGLSELSLSIWNKTREEVSDPNYFDYYAASSDQFDEVATTALLLKKPVERSNAASQICGLGFNCTFTINFTAPGYKCQEVANGLGTDLKEVNGEVPPFNTSSIVPYGNFSYRVDATRGEYLNPQINETLSGGVPKRPGPWHRSFGALRTEPVLWVGYAHVDNTSEPQPENSSVPGWDTAYTPKIFTCVLYETKYEVEFNYINLVQATTIKNRTYLDPVIDTQYVFGPDDGTQDNTTATPESNYILPTQVQRYRRAMAYHSSAYRFRQFINGTIIKVNNIANTKALQTRLIDQHNYLGVNDLMTQMMSVYEDVILSMFSNPRFLAVVWAGNTSSVTGHNLGDDTAHPCTLERTDNRYHYRVGDLWAVYSVAILLAIVGVGFGVTAVWEEGLVRNTRFSSIVAATRGPGLEKLPWNQTVPGSDQRPVTGARVGYGLVPTDINPGSTERYGFGVEGDVKQRAETPSRTPTGLGSPFNRASRRWSKIAQPPPNI
ncbi:hypothetical protein CkaCkLH20_01563 [Colletotrichum karsti]|uniref:Formylmethionine deformylase-like protein n=1 Tax=Colletotrichum karsti TaxID=1095194 RepID=A0A9P6IH15_9PEZI|nr:uncharacterized protein CkaCkLH20_01563 [Colletotrichum karsti]KAF9880521.1 hypothetical protein CkaCkLH20_01563 [Colletotrichum karsti]